MTLLACLAVSIALSPWAARWGLPTFSPQTVMVVSGLLAGLALFTFQARRVDRVSAIQRAHELHDTRQRLASSEALLKELRQVESSVRQTEEQFRRAFEDANVGMVIADCDLNICQANGAFCQMMGLTRDELIHRNVVDLTHPDDREVTRQRAETLKRDAPHRMSIEKRYVRNDGQIIWGLANVALVRDEQDKPRFFVAHVQDISETRRATEELRVNAERLRACIENTPNVAVQWYDHLGRVIFWNRASEALVGWTSAEAQGRSPADLFATGNEPDEFIRSLREVERTGQTVGPFECKVRHRDGSQRTCLSTLFSIPASGGERYFVCMDVDITERKKLEAQLRQAQKMEAIGTLAGGIAHDFNNILGSIIGFTELARFDSTGNKVVLQNLNDALKASHRAKGLVQQILAFSRQQESHAQPVQFGPIVREAAKLLRAAAPASIQFSIQIAEPLPTVLADPTQLHQMVMNLGTNAIQSIESGHGAVSLSLEAFAADETFVAAHPEMNMGPHVRLAVSDSGSGMNSETMDHMFDPFFTTKPPGEGSGLGLSVVHGIVKNHQGIITVQSQPGKGTTFHIILPAAARENPAPVSSDNVIARSERGCRQHILFVDDEPTLGIVGRKVLERCGYRVTVETDPREALETFQRSPGDFDLVITDLTMPPMDGLTLAAKLQGLRPGLPILLTTGHGAGITLEAVRRAGIRDLLFKPNDLETIGEAVSRALEVKSHGP
ncbi:MAG TPA: PAS domain S-box protein [Verrucomicrobiae bacterium]|nr:PAS domain S-box protein [Verrucomicrobiae bacterium]